jgi:ABC-type glycerol-3-phosphate transport system substrate-binding protein
MLEGGSIVKDLMSRRVLALLTICVLVFAPVSVVAAETINIGHFVSLDQWNDRWGPQVNYCKVTTGLELNSIYIPHSQYSEKLLLMAAVGDMPDLLLIPPERIASITDAGLLEDVEPWIKKTELDQRAWFPPALNSTYYAGITVGLPAYVINYTYAYNRDILNDRGIVSPRPDEWLSWDMVWDIAKKATLDQDGDGTPEIWGFFNNTTFVQVLALIRQAGGDAFNADGFVEFSKQPTRDAVQFTLDMINEKLHAPSAGLFTDGKMATMRMGSGNTTNVLAQKHRMSVGTAAGIMNKVKSDVSYITTWSLPVASQNKEAAFRFASCMVSREAQGFVSARGVVPMRRDAALAEDRRDLLIGLINNLEYSVSYPYHPEVEFVQSTFDGVMKPVWQGQAGVVSTLESLERVINAHLAERLNK